MRALIVGCGYVGLALGAELVRRGHSVWGMRRRRDARDELDASGITLVTADVTQPKTLELAPRGMDWIVYCPSAGTGGTDAYRQVYVNGMRNLLAWLAPEPPRRLVYTSSTGVYGQDDGSTVDETSATEPESETGRLLLEAEQTLLAGAKAGKFSGTALRLAGIYGPGRGYWLRQFLNGEAVLEGGGERIINMVHRDDVAGAAVAILEAANPGEIYNGVDNEPVTQLELFKWLANRLGRPLPTAGAEPVSGVRRRAATNKRVSNARLRTDLHYALRYPSFREGYEAELRRQAR